MPRIRSVKPDFFLDFELSRLAPIARLFFIGLWTQADRDGRLEDEPHKLKAQIIPWDDFEAEKLLCDLAPKFITRYKTKSGDKYLQINAWHHQKPHHTERVSVIPPPLTVKRRLKHGDLTARKGEDEGEDSLSMEKEKINGWFETLWSLYPKREGKKEAFRHLGASVVTEEQFQACRRAVENYKAKIAKEKIEFKYVKMGSTFFNNWHDFENYKGETNEPKSTRLHPLYDNEPFR